MEKRGINVVLFANKSGAWTGYVPAMPAAVSQGKTEKEAVDNTLKAYKSVIDAYNKMYLEGVSTTKANI